MEEKAFIRGGLSFWKCYVCGRWHEGNNNICPMKEVFDDIKNKCSLWITDDIRGSSETKSEDRWVSMSIVDKLEKKHLENQKEGE